MNIYTVSHQKESKWDGVSHEEILGCFDSEELAIEQTKLLITELEEEYRNQGFDKIEFTDGLTSINCAVLRINATYDKVWHHFSIDRISLNEFGRPTESLM